MPIVLERAKGLSGSVAFRDLPVGAIFSLTKDNPVFFQKSEIDLIKLGITESDDPYEEEEDLYFFAINLSTGKMSEVVNSSTICIPLNADKEIVISM